MHKEEARRSAAAYVYVYSYPERARKRRREAASLRDESKETVTLPDWRIAKAGSFLTYWMQLVDKPVARELLLLLRYRIARWEIYMYTVSPGETLALCDIAGRKNASEEDEGVRA